MGKTRKCANCVIASCAISGSCLYEAALRVRATQRPDQRVVARLAIIDPRWQADGLLRRQSSHDTSGRENVTVRWGESRRDEPNDDDHSDQVLQRIHKTGDNPATRGGQAGTDIHRTLFV